MNVLKGMAAKALDPPEPLHIKVDVDSFFKDPREYIEYVDEKAYRISPKAIYKPLDCIKEINW